jgi:hypothetical protein
MHAAADPTFGSLHRPVSRVGVIELNMQRVSGKGTLLPHLLQGGIQFC